MADDAPVLSRGLSYPLGDPPGPGQAVQAAPGVLWLRLPLPFALEHVNVYAIRDGEGWTVIDTGLSTSVTRQMWDALLAGPLEGRPVVRVLCTHMHPDHIGLAGWLCERFEAPLWMSRLEYVTGRMLLAETGTPAPPEHARFLTAAGWTEAQIETWRAEYGLFGKRVTPLPRTYQRVSDGDIVRIGGDDWTVTVGSGHSPEHVCLWRRADDVILAGDQMLPRISSNVSVYPTEPQADPLADWLGSLDRLEALWPANAFILPAHGEPFHGLHTRVAALKRGHAVSLDRLVRALAEPKRAVDLFVAVFGRSIDDGLLGMATGECLAHLNHLERRGVVTRQRDAAGVDWWRAA